MRYLQLIFSGCLIGIANVIPGVSGGTMAVSLGIYDEMIAAVSGLRKQFKKGMKILLPLLVGMGIGIVAFARVLEYLLSHYTLQTGMAFIGLIFGGIPVLYRAMSQGFSRQGGKKFTLSNGIAFVIFFALVIVLPLLKSHDVETAVIAATGKNAVLMFLIGILAAATMVIPGVSGSMILMILGYYYGVINAINSFVDALKALDFGAMLSLCVILVPFGIGVLIGIAGIAKLMEYLLTKHCTTTYYAIFGLVLASPFGILYNTGVFGTKANAGAILVGSLLLVVCAAFTWLYTEKTKKAEQEKTRYTE